MRAEPMLSKDTMRKLTPLLLAFVFIILLSLYNFKLYTNNYYTLFDLGLGYRLSYLFSQSFAPVNWPVPHALVSAMPYTKMFYMVTGLTLLVYNSPLTILIDQTIVIGLGSYALFRIAEIKSGSYRIALAFQILYFLFPSTYGYMAQGGNYMVFLEGFLLLNYMSFLQKRWAIFVVTGILGAMTNSWAPGIFFLLYMVEFIRRGSHKPMVARLLQTVTSARRYFRSTGAGSSRGEILRRVSQSVINGIREARVLLTPSFLRRRAPLVAVVLAWAVIFALEAHVYSIGGLLNASRLGSNAYATGSSGANTDIAVLLSSDVPAKAIYVFGQLSPLFFTSLLSLFILPVIAYFALLSATTNYVPYYNPFEQYPYLYAGFLFISSVTFISKIPKSEIVNKLLLLMIASSIISFCLLSPFSIANVSSGQLGSQLEESPLVSNINHAYSLVPVHTSVFIQNDMPQLMNRDKVYIQGYYSNQTVDYAVLNPLAFNNIARAFGGFSLFWANHFAGNSSYGVYESVQGVVVYKLGFQGSPVYYVPYNASQQIMNSFEIGQPLPYGQYSVNYFFLSPGSYSITYAMSVASGYNPPHQFVLKTYQSNGQLLSFQVNSTYESASTPGLYLLQFHLNSSNFNELKFSLLCYNGFTSPTSFSLDSVSVVQAAP